MRQLTELKGKAMERWLEDALGWPRGYIASIDLDKINLKEHPLYKLLEKKYNGTIRT